MNAQSNAGKNTESEDLYWIVQDGRVGFIDSTGRVVIKPQFVITYPFFSEGLVAVLIGNEEKQKTAFIDTKGRIIFETDDSPSEKGFSSGVAVLLADHSSGHYYVDKKGRWIAGYYNDAKDCTEGLCAVKFESMGSKHYGYINTSGATVIKGQFDYAYPFAEGVARVSMVPDDRKDDDIGPPFWGCKYGFIDRSGTPITPIHFDGASDFSEGMAEVKLGDKWGYIDHTGQMVIAPQYEETGPFKNGLARIKVNGVWGFIDKPGQQVILARFEFARDFSDDWTVVGFQKGVFTFYIDLTGRKVLDVPYGRGVGGFRNGVAAVCENNKCGLMNKAGEIIVSPRFKELEMSSDELIRVTDEKNRIGYMNYRGEFVWKPSR